VAATIVFSGMRVVLEMDALRCAIGPNSSVSRRKRASRYAFIVQL
jgi:hypothetical protein